MAKMKGGLGRGLGELLQVVEINPHETSAVSNVTENGEAAIDGLMYIDINEIKPNENQPRKVFDEEEINELTASIEKLGVITPITLRKAEVGYEIVAGERRWRAARRAKLTKVPCIIKDLTEEENMVISIVENMQRVDLNPIEEAEALSQLIKKYGYSQEDVSQNVGKSRSYVTNSLRLLKLPEKIRDLVRSGDISNGHAKVLLSIEEDKKQEILAEKIIKEQISVRELETLVRNLGKAKKKEKAKAKEAEIAAIEDDLKQILGTKVSIKQSGRKGKLEIEYYSKEELERLIEFIKNIK